MRTLPTDPLADIPIPERVANLPKADLHVHQEWFARLDRVLARREGLAPYDWRGWARKLMKDVPPGMPRLRRLAQVRPVARESDAEPENFIDSVEDLLEEAAEDGAVLVEARFGSETVLRPNFMELFREAERRTQERHPALCAEAVVSLFSWYEPERVERLLRACLRTAEEGLAGIDLLYEAYDTEADWGTAYRLAERAAAAGLGVTVHAGEFSAANVAAALRLPGLSRIGHAVFAADDPRLMELLADSGVTIECCPSCNVVLGAVPSYEEHPIRRFVAAGIPVALCTDDPMQVCTTIGREYAMAAALGFSEKDLLDFTRNALSVSFAPAGRKERLLAKVDEPQDIQKR